MIVSVLAAIVCGYMLGAVVTMWASDRKENSGLLELVGVVSSQQAEIDHLTELLLDCDCGDDDDDDEFDFSADDDCGGGNAKRGA